MRTLMRYGLALLGAAVTFFVVLLLMFLLKQDDVISGVIAGAASQSVWLLGIGYRERKAKVDRDDLAERLGDICFGPMMGRIYRARAGRGWDNLDYWCELQRRADHLLALIDDPRWKWKKGG